MDKETAIARMQIEALEEVEYCRRAIAWCRSQLGIEQHGAEEAEKRALEFGVRLERAQGREALAFSVRRCRHRTTCAPEVPPPVARDRPRDDVRSLRREEGAMTCPAIAAIEALISALCVRKRDVLILYGARRALAVVRALACRPCRHPDADCRGPAIVRRDDSGSGGAP